MQSQLGAVMVWDIGPGSLSKESPSELPPLSTLEVCLEEVHHPETSTTSLPSAFTPSLLWIFATHWEFLS